jgi:hypothetical protein
MILYVTICELLHNHPLKGTKKKSFMSLHPYRYIPHLKQKKSRRLPSKLTLAKILIVAIIIETLIVIHFWPRPKEHITNACTLINQHPTWYVDALKSQKRWGAPINVQLAIINHESHFKASATTRNKSFFGIALPGTHISTALGYTQALDGTWAIYKNHTSNPHALRSSFSAATDFVGWFIHRAVQYAGVNPNDTKNLYLAYHEGIAGFIHHSYQKKPWLMKIASQVQEAANIYKHQLAHCTITR